MNKLTIPAILVATVMVAGVFAFMPVQEASTVHTSTAFTENSIRYFTVTATCNVTDGDVDDCQDLNIDIPTGALYRVHSATMLTSDGTAGATTDIAFTACTAGGVLAVSTDLVLDTEGAIGAAEQNRADQDFLPIVPVQLYVGTAVTDDIRCDGINVTTNGDVVVVAINLEINADAADPTVSKFDAT